MSNNFGKLVQRISSFVEKNCDSIVFNIFYENQEDKKALFDCGDTLLNCLSAMRLSIDSIKLNKDVAKMASKKGFSTATDFADYLVNKKVPFRDAHEIVGKAVVFAIKKNLRPLS